MPSPERGCHVLILVPGRLGEKLSGPEIRAVRLGQALTAEHRVTLMAPGAAGGEHDGLPVVPFSRRGLLREARRHDVLMASTVPPFALALKRSLRIVAISDQYDPVEIELGTLAKGAKRARATARAARRLQLRSADLVLCAGQRQRELLEAEIETFGESNRPPLRNVPFGIDGELPLGNGHPLREHFAQIGADDKVVLWWGSLWRWLDAETAIRAVASLADSRPDVKLVFTAGRPPNGDAERHSVLAEAKGLAAELGVLDRSVLFLEQWVPFAQRGDYLRDADLGLTLHRDTEEASLAARARYMDYLSAGLPCVLGRGDETAERFEQSGFATLVEAGSPTAVAAAILASLDEQARVKATAAGHRLADEFRWGRVAVPLLVELREISPEASASTGSRQLGRTTSYYARRVVDRLLPSH
ncbi:MAG TPA: glycosyltransferase family 4 protein [Solirubrobacterales bacterium]|nr:glycosyltransferase family 4 protein [Solirubrobacterales bacterium]